MDNTQKIIAAVIVVALLQLAAIAVVMNALTIDEQAMGVTNFDSLHLSDTGGTATPVLRANQDGTGKIVEFLDAGTPVWSLNDGGGISQGGGNLDMGNNLITNIGAAGTDFTSGGGLITALGVTITSGGLTVTAGGITVSDGDMVVADDLRVTAQTSQTVTNATAFTATGTYQPITAAGEVTPTITAGTAGDLLVIINTSDQTINIADTGTQMLTAAAVLGQYDSLTLWSDGTNWIEISRADN